VTVRVEVEYQNISFFVIQEFKEPSSQLIPYVFIKSHRFYLLYYQLHSVESDTVYVSYPICFYVCSQSHPSFTSEISHISRFYLQSEGFQSYPSLVPLFSPTDLPSKPP